MSNNSNNNTNMNTNHISPFVPNALFLYPLKTLGWSDHSLYMGDTGKREVWQIFQYQGGEFQKGGDHFKSGF